MVEVKRETGWRARLKVTHCARIPKWVPKWDSGRRRPGRGGVVAGHAAGVGIAVRLTN